MALYEHRIYPALVDRLGNPAPIQKLRRRFVPIARGAVLEIGVGTGTNFPYYDRNAVEVLYALEPNPGMLRLAEQQRRQTHLNVEFLSQPGERIPLADHGVDTVVTTFTLCTISALDQALDEIARVLKPSGILIFIENSVASHAGVRRWQQRWEPIHHWMFEGLRLTRDIPALIADAGFTMTCVERLYLSSFPKSWTHCCAGTATRDSRIRR